MNTKTITSISGLICLIGCLLQTTTAFSQTGEYMRANLYYIPASGPRVLVDGNLTQYDNQYSNNVDINDVWKMTNLGENFGIIREGYTLVMERRRVVPVGDTTYFRLWNLQQKDYQIEFVIKGCNHPDLNAFLTDNYLGSQTALGTNDTTRINFTVTAVPESYAQNRFTVVYKTMAVNALPLVISSVTSQKKNSGIAFEWKVENETDIANYVVERSADGNYFEAINTTSAVNAGSSRNYSTFDASPLKGDNYYRVRATTASNRLIFSSVSKTRFEDNTSGISIYPNPVVNKNINIITNLLPGLYDISIYHSNGVKVISQTMKVSSPMLFNTKLPAYATPGIYNVIITGPANFRHTERITLL